MLNSMSVKHQMCFKASSLANDVETRARSKIIYSVYSAAERTPSPTMLQMCSFSLSLIWMSLTPLLEQSNISFFFIQLKQVVFDQANDDGFSHSTITHSQLLQLLHSILHPNNHLANEHTLSDLLVFFTETKHSHDIKCLNGPGCI